MDSSQLDRDPARGAKLQEAVEVAQEIISGRMGLIEGCRILSSLSRSIVPDWTVDEDFVVFGALDSETDHLPVGTVRQYWAPAALAEKDQQIARIERDARPDVERACKSVVARFGAA